MQLIKSATLILKWDEIMLQTYKRAIESDNVMNIIKISTHLDLKVLWIVDVGLEIPCA